MLETRDDSPSTKVLIQEYKNWPEFVWQAEQAKESYPGITRNSRSDSPTKIADTMGTWAEVSKLARLGWYDKVKETHEYRDQVVRRIAKQVKKMQWTQDVTGTDFDIAKVLSGEPDCWIEPVYKIKKGPSKRLIKVTVNICINSYVDCKLVVERGLIIMAMVQLLEYSGRRVELTAISATTRRQEHKLILKIRLKEFEAMLDAPHCLFAIAHPGALRRIEFGVCETIPKMFAEGLGIGSGYGSADSVPLAMRGDIHLDKGFFDMPNYEPFEWIIKEMKVQGVEFNS